MEKTPFFDILNRKADFDQFLAGAKADEDYIDWNGYVLPADFGNAEEEYFAIRRECAIFDDSPLKKVRIIGDDAGRFLDRLLTRPVSNAEPLRGLYVIFCNEDGTLKDDAILYKFADDDYLLMPSDIDHTRYLTDLAARLDCRSVSIRDCTDELVGIALQGPLSAAVTLDMGYHDAEQMVPFEIHHFPFHGDDIMVARMGFTGDLGYEFWMKPDQSESFMEDIRAVRERMGLAIPGYGLAALEACRIEGGFVVAGWDFATEIDDAPGFERNPFEVGLGWAVDLNAVDFVGSEALRCLKNNSKYVIRRFMADASAESIAEAPIHGRVDGEDVVVGSVNCASWSWGLGKTIGTVSLLKEHAKVGSYFVHVNDETLTIELSRGPPVQLARYKQVPAPLESH